MSSEVIKLSPEALEAWAQYDPPEMKLEATRIRYAFMSGYIAASVGRNAKRQDRETGLGPKDEHAVDAEGSETPNPSEHPTRGDIV